VPGSRRLSQRISEGDGIAVIACVDDAGAARDAEAQGAKALALSRAIDGIRAATSLRVSDRYTFGGHYAETLRRWRERFEARAAEVAHLGFDETFRRLWSLYLAYSEAGFRTGYLDVAQFTLTKPVR